MCCRANKCHILFAPFNSNLDKFSSDSSPFIYARLNAFTGKRHFIKTQSWYWDPQIHSPLKTTEKRVPRKTSEGLFSRCQSFEEKDLSHGDGIQLILDVGPFKTSGLWGTRERRQWSQGSVFLNKTMLEGSEEFLTLIWMSVIV